MCGGMGAQRWNTHTHAAHEGVASCFLTRLWFECQFFFLPASLFAGLLKNFRPDLPWNVVRGWGLTSRRTLSGADRIQKSKTEISLAWHIKCMFSNILYIFVQIKHRACQKLRTEQTGCFLLYVKAKHQRPGAVSPPMFTLNCFPWDCWILTSTSHLLFRALKSRWYIH